MSRTRPGAMLLLLTITLCPLATAGSSIEWQPSAEPALALAAAEGRPLFIAVNMDNERANDEMIATHYKDPNIRKLAAKTVNLFASRFDHRSADRPCSRAGTITCAQHMAVEKEARKNWLKQAGDGSVIAPQHVFLDGDGKVLLSVPYRVSVGELEWCFVTAIRALDPDFPWTLSDRARAPKRLVKGGVAEPGEDMPRQTPTKKEVSEILERLKRTGRGEGGRETISEVARLLLSEDKRALDYAKGMMNSKFFTRGEHPRRLIDLIHNIGRFSPQVWWEVVAEFADDHRVDVRAEAAVALEQLAAPKSLGTVLKQWKKEKETDARKEQIRAVAGIAPDSKKVIKLVTDQTRKAKDDVVRISAVIGTASLEDRDAVITVVRGALVNELGGMRAAAAYVIALRKEEQLRKDLEQASLLEKDANVKDALERAINVLNGSPASELDPILREFARSEIKRDRL